MNQAITQQHDYGCGIACFAFACEITYGQAVRFLGSEQANSTRFWCKDLAVALNNYGLNYSYKYVKPRLKPLIYKDGSIVLVARSKKYPTGHYLARHNGFWMDPWINLISNRNIANAQAGFRKRLPGRAMYVIFVLE